MSRFIFTVLVFALLGPIVGSLGVLLGLTVGVGLQDPANALNMLFLTPFALIVGGVVGFLPAAACGLVAAAVSAKLRSTAAWALACTVIGALLGAGAGRLVAPNYEWWILAAAGGFAALICAFASLRLRPRPPEAVAA